ncbi:GNAT family N-acetyltransferase [Actinoplanes sp. NPDC023801]|uniref:GNAT family N-acetyltransferase n=1 Tax=Actinoplanes sp. NPDC023801 TaxID=3154595 RepID=UPI0033C230E5
MSIVDPLSRELSAVTDATAADLEGILKLQYLCYQSEAQRYDFWGIPALTQSMASIAEDLAVKPMPVIRLDGEVVGSVRGELVEGTFHIGRLVVHPRVQRRGLGRRLLAAVEQRAGAADRFEVYTGYRSTEFLGLYQACGYQPFKHEQVTDRLRLTYLEKPARP